jgi:hypothetical protein
MQSISMVCHQCAQEILPPDEGWETDCPHCGAHLDLHGQFAYLRGVHAFQEGEQILGELPYLKKARKEMGFRFRYSDREREAFAFFSESYTALQEAFQYALPETQRTHGVDMMIHMARLFLPRNMISSLEAGYWNSLMIFQNAALEAQELNEKIAVSRGMKLTLWGWRWRSRLKKLNQAMADLDTKIRRMETEMAFAHPQRVYEKV